MMDREPSEAAPPEQVLQELSHDLMSPYCPGRTIASCPSGLARKLEDRILTEAEAGKTREQIEQELVAEFGSQIRGYEAPSAIVWGSWIAAIFAMMLILRIGRQWVRRNRAAAAAPSGTPAGTADAPREASSAGHKGLSEADRDRLEDALDEEEGF